MPDFERLNDKLQQDMADTPQKKAYWIGYSKGKTKARIEILLIASVITVLMLNILSSSVNR